MTPLRLKEPIRLLVADIDGCLSGGSSTHFSMTLLERLRHANSASRTDSLVPAVTFCTGRPQPYVECLMQATGGYMPALCEGGAVFFDPATHAVLTHPAFGAREQERLDEIHDLVRRELTGPHVMFEPGKVTHITLIVTPPLRPTDIIEKARDIAARFGDEFLVESTRVCVHILFRHIHKGTGIEWLAEHTGIPPSRMAGMGDAAPDIPFLSLMAAACAPANAAEEVRRICAHASDRPDAEAAMEFLDLIIEANRQLAAEREPPHP
ncbi:MAG: HAD hydrolase family protein [Candidatus Sumerlaeaceae bacterium]|nr:HAD hydrolase family protein [Candidatus Sumerlaeaceae bacterium]